MDSALFEGALYLIGLFFIFESFIYFSGGKDFKAVVMAAMLLNYGAASIYSGIFISDYMVRLPWLIGAENILSVLAASPNVVLMVKSFWTKDFRWKKSYSVLFVLPAVIPFLLIPYYRLPLAEKIEVINQITQGRASLYDSFQVLVTTHYLITVSSMVFIVVSIYLNFNWNIVVKRFRRKVMIGGVTIGLYCLFVIVYWAEHFFFPIESRALKGAKFCFYFIASYWYFRFLIYWPYRFKHGMVYFDTKTFRLENYFDKYFRNINIAEIERELKKIFEEQKKYLDSELTAPVLAESLGISLHQLSAYLNHYYEMTFNELINQKRVLEAMKILREKSESRIVDVCYDVGYNSSSAFYKAFHDYTGMSPKEWRAKETK